MYACIVLCLQGRASQPEAGAESFLCAFSDAVYLATSEMIGVCLNAIIIVLERQYKRYFEMDLTAE